jgi:hypothetical protein
MQEAASFDVPCGPGKETHTEVGISHPDQVPPTRGAETPDLGLLGLLGLVTALSTGKGKSDKDE